MRLVGLKILEHFNVVEGTRVITPVPNTLRDVSTIPPSRGSRHSRDWIESLYVKGIYMRVTSMKLF